MKKGRHRRFEEARALKRSFEVDLDRALADDPLAPREPCEECGSAPGAAHASWCMADEAEDDPYGDEESA